MAKETTSSAYTIAGLSCGTSYTFRVSAYGDGTMYRAVWGPSVSISATPPCPTVTIARHIGTPVGVFEDTDVWFTLTIDPAPTSAIQVRVSVIDMPSGAFLQANEPLTREIPIPAGHMTADFEVRVDDDSTDEVDGSITVMVQSGTGYSVGSPDFRFVAIWDDDKPDAPTMLRANGDLIGDEITLRWKPVLGATGYGVRYVEEVCYPSGVCEPAGGNHPRWQEQAVTATITGMVAEATTDGPDEDTLYRIQARSTVVSDSDWPDEFALLFPTDSPFGGGTVATAPFHGYQAKNAQGSHEFRYVICTETITSDVTTSPSNLNRSRSKLEIIDDIEDAVDKWENTVIWDKGGANIITTMRYHLPVDEGCTHPIIPGTGVFAEIPDEDGRFEIKFVDNGRIRRACDPLKFSGMGPPGCWRSKSWETPGIQRIRSGVILLNASLGANYFNSTFGSPAGCTNLHELVIHEAGHAFGIGNRTGFNFNRHPINTTYSIMSYDDPSRYCEPQAYDIVALMANYQSR